MNLTFDNIIFSLQRAGGISVVWYELLKRALEDKQTETSFLDLPNQNIFRKQLEISPELVLNNPLEKLPVKMQRYINPNKLPKTGIFHSSYYRTSNSPGLLNVTTVHDFTYEYFRKGLPKTIHSWQKGLAIKNAHRIICVSTNTKRDLLKFYPGTPPEKVKVIYNGVDESYKVLANSNLNDLKELVPFHSKEYAVFVGDRASNHKNFLIALKACKKTNTPIVLIGGGEISKKEKYQFDQQKFIAYKHLTGIHNEKLNIIYNHALCLLYPSSYEGFGIPVIEAQKAGCPVITSNDSSIPEIAGKGALLMNNISVNNLSELIQQVKTNSNLISETIAEGIRNSNRFSWDMCYQQTKELYQELYEEYS